jgi:catechol 2,3-dioxygenase-like lactoylglutathione lyase family enzyme
MPRILQNHYVLAVPDAARSEQFFVDILGFETVPVDDDGWRFVRKDHVMVMLGSCPDALPPGELGDHSYFGYLVVDDVDQYYSTVRAHGVDLIKHLRNEPWGMREFGLRTPDGHRLMIGQRLDG